MKVAVDKHLEAIAEAMTPVTVELAPLRVGVDRHLELLSSTEWFKEVDHRDSAALSNHGRGLLGHIDLHATINPCLRRMIPRLFEPGETPADDLAPRSFRSCQYTNMCSILEQ